MEQQRVGVGVKMLIDPWYQTPTSLSLVVIAIVLNSAVGFSMKVDGTTPLAESHGTADRH